jgi:hypothetical protein
MNEQVLHLFHLLDQSQEVTRLLLSLVIASQDCSLLQYLHRKFLTHVTVGIIKLLVVNDRNRG